MKEARASNAGGLRCPRYLDAALTYLGRAVADDNAREAMLVLEMIGRELLSRGKPRVLVVVGTSRVPNEGDILVLPDDLVVGLAACSGLVARAARSLGMLVEMDGARALLAMLYARSGYQALVDARVWQTNPTRMAHLAESDQEIVDGVATLGLPVDEVPLWVPPSHTWWPKRAHDLFGR